LEHHRGRLDDRRRRRAGLETELVYRLARHDRDDAKRARVKLDLGEQALDLDLPDGAAEAVPGRELARLAPAQAGDLPGRDGAAVGGVSARADAAVPVPAPQGVDADPKRSRSFGGGVRPLPRHCLDTSRFIRLLLLRLLV